MAQESEVQLVNNGGFWRQWRLRILIVFLTLAVLGSGGWYLWSRRGADEAPQAQEELPEVTVRPYRELAQEAKLEKVGTIEPALAAPLIARTGGRVTNMLAHLGDQVEADQAVVEIDGGNEPNIASAQLATASSSLVAFESIRSAALASADLAIASAQQGREAAAAGKILTADQVAVGRQQADLAVREAELRMSDLQEGDEATDALLRSADLALQAAELAQDQATIARDSANQQSRDALAATELNLASSRQAKEKLIADLASQRVALEGQAALAREAIRLSQVTAPLAGQVITLSVTRGDFVQPGQKIGEINAFAGARVTIEVPAGVRDQLSLGQQVTLRHRDQEFFGELSRLADGPHTQTALWQIEIFISATPTVIHPGELITVELPLGARTDVEFIPLDAVVVREGGIVLFTVDGSGVVAEHDVAVTGFIGDFVKGTVPVDAAALVVVSGNRTLTAGQIVRVRTP